ncbi:hypothetical protein SMKC034_26310 [Serratia marcescens]|nr:hypothetical protein SMKC034_26310 [Serratia marcescens]CAI1798689.1 Uncharacterised protein [Serratia marcescens]
MIEFLDFDSPSYKLKQNENGNWEAIRTSNSWCVEFTNLYRNIRDNYELILTHPKNPRSDEDVDYIIFRK